MTKVRSDADITEHLFRKTGRRFVPLCFCLCCGFLPLGGCRSLATEVKAKLCIVEPGIPLPPECLTPVGEASKATREPEPSDDR